MGTPLQKRARVNMTKPRAEQQPRLSWSKPAAAPWALSPSASSRREPQPPLCPMVAPLPVRNPFPWEGNLGENGYIYEASQVALVVNNLPANAGGMKPGFDPWVGKIPWRRAWQPTPVFLPGASHGQRSLAGYSP